MNKPLFNLFYSLSVNKTLRGGSSTPSVAPANSVAEKDIKDVLDNIDYYSMKITAKAAEIHGILKYKEGKAKVPKGYSNVVKRLNLLKKGVARKVYSLHTKTELEKYKRKILKKLKTIEAEMDLMQSKIKLKKELKKIAQESRKQYLQNWDDDVPTGIKNAISKKELSTLVNGHIDKWYKKNSKAIGSLKVIPSKKNLSKDLETKKKEIKEEIDLLIKSIELQKKLKEIAQKAIEEHLQSWEQDKPEGIKKAASRREILIMVTGYIGRWYKVNSTAISKLSTLKTIKENLVNFKATPPKGELFDDLATINKEIKEKVYSRWITGMESKEYEDVLRTVYSKLGWEDKFMKDIKDVDVRQFVRSFNHLIQVDMSQKMLVSNLLTYIKSNKVPGNLPDFPGNPNVIKASGILSGIIKDVPKPAVAITPASSTPSTNAFGPRAQSVQSIFNAVPSEIEKKEKHIKQYKTAQEAEFKNLEGVTFTLYKAPRANKEDIMYKIYKDSKFLGFTYYRPNDAQQYGVDGKDDWVDGGSPSACAKGNVKLLKQIHNLEDLDLNKKPTITKMSYANGTLNIVGENLPPEPLIVKLPKVVRTENLIKGGISYEKANVDKLAYGANNINTLLIKNVLSKVSDGLLKDQLAKKLNDQKKGIPILKKILKTGEKPKLRVIGRASFDGRFAGNMDFARKRAANAKKKIEAKLGGPGQQAVELIPVPEVVGPKGVAIKAGGLTKAYMDMKKMWNVLPGNKKKVKSGGEMKGLVSKYIDTKGDFTPAELKFLKETLDDQRNVQIELVPPKNPTTKFTIKFESPNPNA